MLRLGNPARVFRLIDDAIARLELDLSGVRVLTEAASGAYVVTPLIAARAGAERVCAVTRSSQYGSAADVLAYGREWAAAFGLADRIEFATGAAADYANEADLVTNLGFVRPIDSALIRRLRQHAVVSLMWEPWELRAGEIDLDACDAAGIPVIGTNERDARLQIFDYVGMLAVKLLLESGVECAHSRVVLIGSDPFGATTETLLTAIGAEVSRVALPADGVSLDEIAGVQVERADAVVLVEHRDRRVLVGSAGGIRVERFGTAGCRLIHVAGAVDDEAVARAGIAKHPAGHVEPGYMTVATDYVGPRPVIDLHAAGLRVGADAVRCRRAGGSVAQAIAAAEASGLGARLTGGRQP